MADKKSSQQVFSQNNFWGIGEYLKQSPIPNQYWFSRSIDYRQDPNALTLLPGALKESGSTVTDLLKWGDLLPSTLDSYFYGNSGNFYHRDSSAAWTNLHTAASSHGNGLAYFFADDYVYYTTDSTFGRYGPTQSSSPQFSDNFLKAQGGVPQNTASILLASASSMYGHAADSASLSVTGDLTLETYFKANTLPTTGNSMSLIAKWDESATARSYKLDLYGVSGYFGDGSDGSLTISSDTTEAPIDSACTGTAGTQSLTATNVLFSVGQVILIHQTQGTSAGQWERNTIQGYTAGTITLATPLIGTYTAGAQVRVMKQYSSVTINSGKTYTAKSWNGTVGGILAFLCDGTLTITGNISANGAGYRGGTGEAYPLEGQQGEGQLGVGIESGTPNGVGGGGGPGLVPDAQGGNIASDTMDLTTAWFGGGGGGTGYTKNDTPQNGGAGGGLLMPWAATISISGNVTSNGVFGGNSSNYAGGSGAGGSILFKCQTFNNSGTINTLGAGSQSSSHTEDLHNGAGGGHATAGENGSATRSGAGGNGRIVIDYLTSVTNTGTIFPTDNDIQDSTLVTTPTIQARLGISNDGTAFEYLTQNLNTLATGKWNRLSVAWTASTSTAQFYLNAVSIGASMGTKTSISDNASLLYIGADKGGATVQDYFDGYLDDTRIWGNVQTAAQIFANNQIQINASSAGLEAYYKFNSAATDATGNANDLTLVNTPTYSSDVPFPDPTTRLDIDTSQDLTGNTYTLPTSISETTANTLTFTPVNDPQASIGFFVDTKGTGDWTVTIHDQQNNIIATQTIANTNVPSGGEIEFVFNPYWRIVIGKTYHAHLTVSTGSSAVVTGTTSNFSTAEYVSYFSFLVTDRDFHPITLFTNKLVIGNERYIATWDGAFYLPNVIAFPTGWRVRCFAQWKEYLAIGVWKGTDITSYDSGRIYFWDGYAPTFNFSIDVSDGQINAMAGRDSDLYIIAGYMGYLLDYQGSYFTDTGNSSSNKLKRFPKRARSDTVEIYPGALNFWRDLLYFGLGANVTSSTMERGVYSWGTLNQLYPATLSYDYPISTGNRFSTVSIGCVFPVGNNLIIGWQDGIAFGADVINFDNNPASSGTIETLAFDDNAIWHDKETLKVRADILPLPANTSVQVKYQIDRSGTWELSTLDSTAGDKFVAVETGDSRGREYQFAVDLYTTGTNSPTLLGISALKNPLVDEQQF